MPKDTETLQAILFSYLSSRSIQVQQGSYKGPTRGQHRANGDQQGLYTGGKKSVTGVNRVQTGRKHGENRGLTGGQQGVK